MTKHILTLDSGEQIAYWSYNDDRKDTIVMIHGFTGSHEGFQYLVPLLSNYRLIIPDLPGFGESPLPHTKINLRELGTIMTDFVSHLDLPDEPYILGHSMGSLIVTEMIRQHPPLFAYKLILISPVPTPVGVVEQRRLGVLFTKLYYLASHRLPKGRSIAKNRQLSWLGTSAIMTTKDRTMQQKIHEHHYNNLNYISDIGWTRRLHAEINRTGMTRYKAALKTFNVLIISGDKDNVTPLSHQKRVAQSIHARLVVIPDVGHLAHYEKPRQIADAIRQFLQN